MTMAESNLTRRDFVAAIVALPMFGAVRRLPRRSRKS